jgi:hypothetical protein
MVTKKPAGAAVELANDLQEMEADFSAGFAEAELNGRSVNWRLWAALPEWTAGEAARLLRGLDPQVFKDLSARPPKTNLADVENATSVAQQIQLLAERTGKLNDSAPGWLAWARKHRIAVLHATVREIVRMRPIPGRKLPTKVPTPVLATPEASAAAIPMKRSALIQEHRTHWPSIEGDLKDANSNGLSMAKAGTRGWDETRALAWARSRGKLKDKVSGARELDGAIRGLAALPSRRNILK